MRPTSTQAPVSRSLRCGDHVIRDSTLLPQLGSPASLYVLVVRVDNGRLNRRLVGETELQAFRKRRIDVAGNRSNGHVLETRRSELVRIRHAVVHVLLR